MKSATNQHIQSSEQQWSVAVNSIGTAGINVVAALRKALPLSDREIAHRLLQAPSILAQNLSYPVAEQMTTLLKHVGLDVEVVDEQHEFAHGDGGYELAITINDFSRVYDVIQAIVALTGISVEQGIHLINRVPAVLIANVSLNNAQVLQQRFSRLGVEVDISLPDQTLYDVFLQGDSYRAQQELLSLARSLGVQVLAPQENTATALMGLDYETAQKLWQMAAEKRIQCRLLNRDYQRYDVRLNRIDEKNLNNLSSLLLEQCGIPERVIPTLIRNFPVVIAANVPLNNAQMIVEALYEIGANAVAELTASLSFNLEFSDVENPEKCQAVLERIGGVSKSKIRDVLKGRLKQLEGPFSYTQARWLAAELKKLNTKVSMKKR